jgi:hypothetical protein
VSGRFFLAHFFIFSTADCTAFDASCTPAQHSLLRGDKLLSVLLFPANNHRLFCSTGDKLFAGVMEPIKSRRHRQLFIAGNNKTQ